MGKLARAAVVSAMLALSACASTPGGEDQPFSFAAAQPDPARHALKEAIALYDAGDFQSAVRKLERSKEIWSSPVPVRIDAYKHLAFANCALNRRVPCRRAFENLLFLEPGFELSAVEAGHPIWGPVFRQAKRDASARAMGNPR